MRSPRIPPSSPGLVRNCALGPGDPVIADASDGIEKPRRTGSPACAGDDDSGSRTTLAYFSPTLNGGSLPGGVVSSDIASIMATMT
jgi:hypothetical protein